MQHHPAALLDVSDLRELGDRIDDAVQEAATRMGQVRAALAEQTRRAEAMEQRAAELERQLAVAEARLAVEQMHSAGLAAQASHLMAVALETELTTITALMEETDAEGRPTTRLAAIYDAAFDVKAAELGIDDPARFRAE